MAPTPFGCVVTGDDFVQWVGTSRLRMKAAGVQKPEQGIPAAKNMVVEGTQLIER